MLNCLNNKPDKARQGIMHFITRTITLEHNGETIAVFANAQKYCFHTITQLIINDRVADEIKTDAIDGLKGCFLELSGTLDSGDDVRAEIRTGLFMRPLYRVFIDDAEIFTLKGTWAGL